MLARGLNHGTTHRALASGIGTRTRTTHVHTIWWYYYTRSSSSIILHCIMTLSSSFISSGMHFKESSQKLSTFLETRSLRRQRIEKFQKAIYVDEETKVVERAALETDRTIAIKSRSIIDPGRVLKGEKQDCHRPAANVGQLIPNFPKNSGPARPVSSRHKRATYFVHHLRARTAGMGSAVRSRQESEAAKLVPDIAQRAIELNVKKIHAKPAGQKFIRMNKRAKSSSRKSPRRLDMTSRGVRFFKFRIDQGSPGNDKSMSGRSPLHNNGSIRVPQIHISPFKSQQENVMPVRGERSAIEIKEKGEDIHAMVRLQSPPTLFDVSDLRGWD